MPGTEPVMILYRDRSLLAVVKPVGMDSEKEMPRILSEQTGERQVFCVHRLDAGVGGVMVYALNGKTAAKLSEAFSGHAAEKTYLALCEGRLSESEGTLRDLLFHDRSRNKTFVVDRVRNGVKEAVLDYRLVKALEGAPIRTLYRVTLHTGRSHQIRVQFASRKCPLSGDRRYGAKSGKEIALWSYRLILPHPDTGNQLEFCEFPPNKEMLPQD